MVAKVYQAHLFNKRIPAPKEVSLHISLVSLLRWALRPDVIMRHVPNGEHRDPRTAAKLKAMGTLAGSADLEFFYKVASGLRVLFLELKTAKGRLSIAQVDFALAMRLLGAEHYVVRSIDEAITILGTRGLLRNDIEVNGRRWP